MIKKAIMLLVLVLLFMAGSSFAATVITTPAELQAMGNDLAGDYILGNDIDMTGVTWEAISWRDGVDFPFTGTFDGDFHIINGFTAADNDPANGPYKNASLFGILGVGGVVKNVGMTNVNVTAGWYASALVGDCYGAISKCFVDGGTVTGVYGGNIGTVVGYVRPGKGTVTDCYSTAELVLTGPYSAGGFTVSSDASFINCYYAGLITGTAGGGFARKGTGGTSNYYDMDVAGFDDGLGEGRTTAEMKTQANFVDWDFENTWTMIEGLTYPVLMEFPHNAFRGLIKLSPANGTEVMPGDVDLSWDNIVLDLNNPGDVYVEVLFGTDPNETDGDMTPLVLDPASGLNVTSVTAEGLGDGTYYWQVNSYLYGDPEIVDYNVGDPNIVKGPLWTFSIVTDPAPVIKSITGDQMTWSGEPVLLDAAIDNPGASATIIEWVADADPNTTVIIEGGDTATPTVTITKAAATGGVETVTLTVLVSDGANPTPVEASVEIDVYDDACAMARLAFDADNLADIEKDCDIDIDDLALMAATWLNDLELDGPVANSTPSEPNLVVNGGFQMYKPGTNYTVTGELVSEYARGLGDNLTTQDGGIVEYSDGTEGTTFDMPGWKALAGGTDFVPNDGVEGVAFRAFGTWGAATGTTAESAEPLGIINSGTAYTLSAMISGPARPYILNLLANGVVVTPSSEVNEDDTGSWVEISRTYDTAALAGHVGESLTVVIGTPPGVTEGIFVRFDNVSLATEVVNENLPTVDAGDDMVTWSGESVTLASTVVNNDTQVPQRDMSYLWTADPSDGVAITGGDTETSTVTITKPAGDMASVNLILAVTLDGVGTVYDTVTIDVYDNACKAAKGNDWQFEYDLGDLTEDCITNLEDFAELAAAWLVDYSSTEPADQPEE